MLAGHRTAVAGHEFGRLLDEAPIARSTAGPGQREVDPAVHAAVAEVPVRQSVQSVAVQQRVEVAQVGTELRRRDGRVLPPRVRRVGQGNAGQTCSASSRILVEQSIYEEVAARMADAYRKLKVGPALSDLDVGPMVSRRQKDIVEGYIALADRSGARLAAQGTIVPEAPAGGAYVTPTLIRDVPPSHRLVQEEIIGPVQVIMPFDGEQQAK